MVNFILADDHQILREGMAMMLNATENYNVIDQVGDIEALKDCVGKQVPDVILLDYRMPVGGTLAAMDYLKRRFPDLKIILLTGIQSSMLFNQLLDSKADGILLKESSSEEILEGTAHVINGQSFFSHDIREMLFKDKPSVSPREFQILDLVAQGHNNNEISERLSLSRKTIENHRFSINRKLDVKNVVELLHVVREAGLIE